MDIEAISLIPDGKESIEHQLEIQVSDLLDIDKHDKFSLQDILAGLRYVVEYRIKGRKLPNLRKEICKELADSLLRIVPQTEGKKLGY